MSMDMIKSCKKCNISLTNEIRSGKRLLCKPCRVKVVVDYQRNNAPARRNYINERARRIGKVRKYPCETCSSLCYKKYASAFCGDKCRFLHYVNKTDSCWIWSGNKNRRGYGASCINSARISAHRMSYELFIGPVPKDMYVCHTCDIPSCVNPAHLWIGTTQDNKIDQLKKDRGGVKLKERDVLEIRNLYSKGKGSQALAYLYNVTCGTISSIIKRRIWKHI